MIAWVVGVTAFTVAMFLLGLHVERISDEEVGKRKKRR